VALAREAAARAEAAVERAADATRFLMSDSRQELRAAVEQSVPEPEGESARRAESREQVAEPAAAGVRSEIAEAGAQAAEEPGPEADPAGAGDERFASGEYAPAVDRYSQWIEKSESGTDRRRLFVVLHNRAVANLRLGRYMDALNDAAALESMTDVSPKAAGATRLLSGVVHLNQGLIDEALEEFGQALVVDPSARKALAKDEDIEAWLGQNPDDARRVRRGLDKLLGREKPRSQPAEKSIAKSQEPKGKSQKPKPAGVKKRARR
jgi:tetratricopeptide (TPR) repeat protein